MTERRKFLRRRTLLQGRIAVERLNGWAVDCAVRNLSAGGARLTLPGRTIVPETFQLAVSTGEPETARLIWYKDGQAGVALLDRAGAQPPAWDGPCRRKAGVPAGEGRAVVTDLRARIDAIAARRGATDGGFTRP